MSKVLLVVLITVLAAVTFAAQEKKAAATQDKKPKVTAAKQARWDGIIVRQSKTESTFTVRKRGGSLEKTIVFNSATKWTKLNKPAEMSLFKDGERIIAVGTLDDKGRIVATHIDLRLQ